MLLNCAQIALEALDRKDFSVHGKAVAYVSGCLAFFYALAFILAAAGPGNCTVGWEDDLAVTTADFSGMWRRQWQWGASLILFAIALAILDLHVLILSLATFIVGVMGIGNTYLPSCLQPAVATLSEVSIDQEAAEDAEAESMPLSNVAVVQPEEA